MTVRKGKADFKVEIVSQELNGCSTPLRTTIITEKRAKSKSGNDDISLKRRERSANSKH